MKLYFVTSPRSIKNNPVFFKNIYEYLAKENKMLNDLVLRMSKGSVDDFYGASHHERVEHYKKTMDAVKKADLVIVDVTEHSMSMGYIINKALEMSKPVIALYEKGFDPYFFSGIEDIKLQIVEYEKERVLDTIERSIEKSRGLADVRFNFFVPPRILQYLDWVAQNRKLPRSVFLRDLIEKEMKKDKEYKEQ